MMKLGKFAVRKHGETLMVVEVKKTVLHLLILMILLYCQYLIRMDELSEFLGTLTDGRVWHTMKLKIQRGMLEVIKYTNVIAKDDIEVIRAIPNLLCL